ncbi:MAG TPA: cyclic nucleotide-binding domain-containing protein, partial [Nitrospirae bacterium]|nr:cyclic nucleotide-binding domain-containing protein [Nitrospirota bacterium]
KHVMLAVLSRGSIAGELSMVDALPRTATIRTLEDARLLILSRDALDAFIKSHPDPGIKLLKGIIRTMSIRMNSFSDRLVKFF